MQTTNVGKLALVALPLPLARPYTYEIPAELESRLVVGQRVLVPLRGRRVTGYLVGFSDERPEGALKSIEDLLDDTPLMPVALMQFLRWLAQYYKASLGEVLACALPSGINREELRYVELSESGQSVVLASAGLSELHSQVIGQLREKGPNSVRNLVRQHRALRVADLMQMQRHGLVELNYRFKKTQSLEKSEEVLRYVEHPSGRLTDQQREILDFLQSRGSATRTEFRAAFAGRSDTLRRLKARGALEIEIVRVFRDPFQGDAIVPHDVPDLTADQSAVLQRLLPALNQGYRGFLLQGVTGSGKTEIYLQLIEAVKSSGRSSLLLVPEIALTPQLAARVRGRFGDDVAMLHSALGPANRYDQWIRILRGEVSIVLGARSAIFAPLTNLGVVIVDEEHEPSFKQEETPRYHARDCALVRGQMAKCPVVLGSATPSLESRANVEQGKLELLRLPERVTPQPLPQVELIDLAGSFSADRHYRFLISPQLKSAMQGTLERGEQTMIFLNRRGFASFVICRACGHTMECKNCSISLTYHRRRNRLVCHYCDANLGLPEKCPACESPHMGRLGFGTERVQSLCQQLFPDARIERMDRDTTRGRKLKKLLDEFRIGKIDVLVGTQMLAKGHDFPNVTLVGVIAADQGLNFPDFRAGERTFQLLTQVAGRAGRGERPGRVLIQTWCPEHYVLNYALKHDFEGFLPRELNYRRDAGYPPFLFLCLLRFSGPDAKRVEDAAREVSSWFRSRIGSGFRTLGPSHAPIERIRGQTRWQLLLKSKERPTLHRLLDGFTTEYRGPSGVRISIDVDPVDLM